MNSILDKKSDIALLITRLIIGGIFITTGWMKVSDFTATLQFFNTLGIAAFLAYFVSFAELIGGILMVLGFWARKSAMVLGVIMIVATWYSLPHGFVGFALPLAMFAGLISIIGAGAGRYSMSVLREPK